MGRMCNFSFRQVIKYNKDSRVIIYFQKQYKCSPRSDKVLVALMFLVPRTGGYDLINNGYHNKHVGYFRLIKRMMSCTLRVNS